jgi:hypothetical protein
MNVCVVITVDMIMLLRDFGPNGIIFMTMCVYYFRFSRLCCRGYKILVGKPGGENTCDLYVETRMKIKANTVLRK